MNSLAGVRHALIVDDDASVSETVSLMLSRLGFETAVANSGQAALAEFRKRPFAVVVTDFLMPEMNGMELALAIRNLAPQVPIIMLTAQASQLRRQPPLPGIDRLLGKPASLADLTAAVEKLVPREPSAALSPQLGRPRGAGPAAMPQ